ncbi:MAG: hypothetical protein OEY20_02530 [Gemmatimonadota bacterium]|nr:hypothetical protein [Gemmatimonadota bacterium]MDH4351110.1 hypothetical protein [Gemmatimonadota bacterium]MDH5196111.1 hypothetical protein [Gemmatimonadota bacterium]
MRRETELVLEGGLFAGLIGYFTIVLFFVVVNIVGGHSPFETAALLGSALFFGLQDPSRLEITPAAVLTFNMVHALVMLVIGFITSWLVTKSEQYPVSQYVVLVALVFVGFHLFGAVYFFASPLMGSGAWLPIAVASIAAAIAMGGYLLWLHPALRQQLRQVPMGEVPHTS